METPTPPRPMRDRRELIVLEEATLAPCAARQSLSRGRVYPEAEHHYRSIYTRDRDRIVHAAAFRRLEYKTQVFVNTEGDHYRTRLTHTLEVVMISRTIARALRLNEDLTEAIALAHDLGHGPFGHSGEDALNELMTDHGGFEHNLQGLRVVDLLEVVSPSYPGLNLTYEVRESFLKHFTSYDAPRSRRAELGFDSQEMMLLEGQVCLVADEIAFDAHDLDDGLRAGLLKEPALRDLALWVQARQAAFRENPALGTAPAKVVQRQCVRALINLMITDLIEQTATRLAEADLKSPDAVRALKEPLVGFSSQTAAEKRALEAFLYENFYRHWRIGRMSAKAKRLLKELFSAYLADARLLPPDHQTRLEAGENLHQVVCDYLAGMTDRYALDEHARLFDPGTPV